MKPDWKDAPEWAQWLAMDYDGQWCWYEYCPTAIDVMWCADEGRYENVGVPTDFRKTLEPRP